MCLFPGFLALAIKYLWFCLMSTSMRHVFNFTDLNDRYFLRLACWVSFCKEYNLAILWRAIGVNSLALQASFKWFKKFIFLKIYIDLLRIFTLSLIWCFWHDLKKINDKKIINEMEWSSESPLFEILGIEVLAGWYNPGELTLWFDGHWPFSVWIGVVLEVFCLCTRKVCVVLFIVFGSQEEKCFPIDFWKVLIEKVILVWSVISSHKNKICFFMMLNILITVAQSWSFSCFEVQSCQWLSDLVGELANVLSSETDHFLAEESQVIIVLSSFPVTGYEYFVLSWNQVNFHVKVSSWRKSSIYVWHWTIFVLPLNNESDRWVFIGLLREEFVVPLTDSQVAVSIIADWENESWVESILVFGFDCRWTVWVVCKGDDDVRNELLWLVGAELENSFFVDWKLYFLVQSSPTVSEFKSAVWFTTQHCEGVVWIETQRDYLLLWNSKNGLTSSDSVSNNVRKIIVCNQIFSHWSSSQVSQEIFSWSGSIENIVTWVNLGICFFN